MWECSTDKGAHSAATRLQKHTGTASNVLSPCMQQPSAPKPMGVVKTVDGRGPQQAEGEHLEARDNSQMTLFWDVTQTALPFNRAQAKKAGDTSRVPCCSGRNATLKLVFRQQCPAHRLWKGSAQNKPTAAAGKVNGAKKSLQSKQTRSLRQTSTKTQRKGKGQWTQAGAREHLT